MGEYTWWHLPFNIIGKALNGGMRKKEQEEGSRGYEGVDCIRSSSRETFRHLKSEQLFSLGGNEFKKIFSVKKTQLISVVIMESD